MSTSNFIVGWYISDRLRNHFGFRLQRWNQRRLRQITICVAGSAVTWYTSTIAHSFSPEFFKTWYYHQSSTIFRNSEVPVSLVLEKIIHTGVNISTFQSTTVHQVSPFINGNDHKKVEDLVLKRKTIDKQSETHNSKINKTLSSGSSHFTKIEKSTTTQEEDIATPPIISPSSVTQSITSKLNEADSQEGITYQLFLFFSSSFAWNNDWKRTP